jgi:hypothetical protein
MPLSIVPLLLFGAAGGAAAEKAATLKVAIDPLELRWTFGNHEPLSMYRRAGNRVTGGMEGSALWLEEWHNWYDSEASAKVMRDLGLNMLHSRFYKGMGWDFESRDFPNVKRFVENCHRHGVRVLAYVQFSTLYYETMLAEVPDLESWAAVDEFGKKHIFGKSYYRWMPCINAPGFEPYLKKVIRIALTEGGFDGIMFDNCHIPACYCPRCAALFREHLARVPDPVRRFGIPTVAHVTPPPPRQPSYGEIQDPMYQQWLQFRCSRATDLFRRLFLHAKSINPKAIVSGNVSGPRRANMAGQTALDVPDLSDAFDIVVAQSGNPPGLAGGHIVNRVRELKLFRALRTPVLALSDNDAGGAVSKGDTLTLIEDAVFGGIPTDRTVMKPEREMVSLRRVAEHRAMLQRFNETVRAGREGLKAPAYEPVRLLYSRESILFSEQSHQALLGAEEILLRNHVPYGLLPTAVARPLAIPADCEALLVCDQRCLADAQVAELARFAQRGGRLIVTGESGAYDEHYRQRKDNPLAKALAGARNAVRRAEVDAAPVKGAGWTIKVSAPPDGGRRLMKDLDAVWPRRVRVQAPPTVFAEVKRSERAWYIHLVNYAPEAVARGARVELPAEGFDPADCSVAAPMENRPAAPVAVKAGSPGWHAIDVPPFADYAVVSVNFKAASK